MRRMASLMACTALAALSTTALAGATGDSNQHDSQIIISIYDLAHVGSKTLIQSEQLVTAIFAAAEVDARWTTGSVLDARPVMLDFSPRDAGECRAALASVLLVQIMARAPSGFPPQALGFSLPCAERGVQVTVYEDRVELVSRTTLASFPRVLAYALVHELGHILLRSSLHTQSGLMKGIWTKSDWQRAAVTIIPFSPDQARFIAARLAAGQNRDSPSLRSSLRVDSAIPPPPKAR